MKIKFNVWRADELIQAYLDYIRKRNSKEVFIKYLSDKYGFKETMEGKLEINDTRLKELPKKIQYTETMHKLEMFQKNWKIEFHLSLIKNSESDYMDKVDLSFDNSLKKEVYAHFKEFEPEEIK